MSARPLPFVPFPREAIRQSITGRFEQQVARHSDRPAVADAGAPAWSYGALNLAANRVARDIAARRGTRSEPVALLMGQGKALVAAILGALRAGKIYVPLDTSAPAAWLAEVLDDAEAALCVCDDAHAALARRLRPAAVLVVDAGAAHPPAEAPVVAVPPDAPAYIYYTSGSTGRPKGVLDSHANVLHNVMRYTNSLRIGADDRLTLLQRASFSGAVSSLFAAVLNGACACPFDVEGEGTEAIAPWLRREAVTIYHSVPSLFRRVGASGLDFPALRVIRLEGDRATPADVEIFQERFGPGCVLVNGLGATECGLVRQYFVPRSERPGALVPVGYPVRDMDVAVLDDTGREVERGEVGEIVVRSRYLALGYWRRPDLTAAAFRPDPREAGTRAYHTGDLGRLRDDGCLEHLGRKDSSPKIRGQRVETGAVETALLALGGLRDAVVVAREAEADAGEPRLVAYLVAAATPPPTVTALRRELGRRLPGAMLPSAWVFLPALPLNDNGKVDRRALPPPAPLRPGLATPHVPPRTPLETAVSRLWEEALGLSGVGIDDDFFELGGHSLLAGRLLTRVRERFGVDVAPGAFFAAPTVGGLALAVLEAHTGPMAAPGRGPAMGDAPGLAGTTPEAFPGSRP